MGRFTFNHSAATATTFRAIDRLWGRRKDRVVTATYTVVEDDDVIVANTTGGAFTVTLPLITAELRGKVITVLATANGVNAVTIAASGGQTIDGGAGGASAATYTPRRYQAVQLTTAPTYGWVSV
jgi:hypothetical protein